MPPGGRHLRRGLPVVVAALLAAQAPAAAEAPTSPVATAQAVADFWAAYVGRTDLRRTAAVLDHRLRTDTGGDTESARRAARILLAHALGHHRRAWAHRLALAGLDVPPRHRRFVAAARAESDRALNLRRTHPAPTTDMGAYGDHLPARMVDGDATTYFWSAGAPRAGTQVVLDLGRVRSLSGVRLVMGQNARPHDYLRSGVIERSVDGITWLPVRQVASPTVVAGLTEATRYLRLRATAGQRHWLAVSEFSVTPAPVDACADGAAETVFPVTSGVAEVPVAGPRPITSVVVLAARHTPPRGEIQLRDGVGAWRTVGRIAGEYSGVSVHGLMASQVRVVFPPGPTVGVHEIVVD
ncbi:F5/8 type C domain-containing protein [Actinokineospora alba]|uniref:F5/8 type C domain-containing protein n=1 Tax=Actinokineospora alba TaxID=504798 RepID=A0A1H0I248_9PSEU|nr:discoidin domain-containing protein [Actinokineospora alba]TDP64642.1 F5/8 type C domain-containing protein [Actinokineospora alba]SDI85206.1 F5/8 type C domain-containing protein [Actinokineospora alba]SDO25465.1 F5/8 type C domain-containing protein [Actinokineospora alba]